MKCAVCMAVKAKAGAGMLGEPTVTMINGTAYCEYHIPKDFMKANGGAEPVVRDQDGKPKLESEVPVGERLENAAPRKRGRPKGTGGWRSNAGALSQSGVQEQ